MNTLTFRPTNGSGNALVANEDPAWRVWMNTGGSWDVVYIDPTTQERIRYGQNYYGVTIGFQSRSRAEAQANKIAAGPTVG